MPKLTLDGEVFAYTLDGPEDAPVVMLSNSLGTTMAMWDSQADFFRQQYRVLRYDTRGHGQSACSAAPYSLQQLGTDVLCLLDALKIQRVHFCGISMGGLIGQWMGIYAAQRLDKLVIANSAAKIGTAEGWHARVRQITDTGMDAVAVGAAGRWFTPGFIAQSPQLVQQYVTQLRACPPQGYTGCCMALADADLRTDIASIKAPTLVITGLYDSVTTCADARFMQGAIGSARYAELAASHLSSVEIPNDFNRIVQEFLG